MVLPSSGNSISLQQIEDEFGGSNEIPIEDYYRDGAYVTSNNTNIPTCSTADCEVSLEDYYDGILILSISITSDITNITMSDYFTPDQWISASPKEIVIETGVKVYSNDINLPAIKTGILNGGAMGGTLKLINNGFVYGASGAAGTSGVGGNGGDSFLAEIPVIIQNNSRIYSGGGGGGKGGNGAGGYYYPDTNVFRYTYPTGYVWVDSFFNSLSVYYNSVSVFFIATPGDSSLVTEYQHTDGYVYERGALKLAVDNGFSDPNYWEVRRRFVSAVAGGIGGNGGRGQGGILNFTSGNTGATSSVSTGGTGGTGGNWGENGSPGANGNAVTVYGRQTVAATVGFSGGQAGDYIVGDGIVTWEGGRGLVLGGIG